MHDKPFREGKLDRVDRSILRILQTDARITNNELADKVDMSESACLRRVKGLEEAGFIQSYAAILNRRMLGLGLSVFVSIKLEQQEEAHLNRFEAAARNIPEILECYLMSGEYDYLLHVALRDMAGFERLHAQHLTRLPHVSQVVSSIALRDVLQRRELPVP